MACVACQVAVAAATGCGGRGAIGILSGVERVSDSERGDDVMRTDNGGDRDGESNKWHSWWR